MATYRNKNDDTIFYGGEFKLKISMGTIGGHDMEDVNFKCTFSTGNTPVVLQKNQMFPVEGDPKSYIAPLNSTALGRGTLVFDGIPVRKNGVGYIYDKVTEQLFGNANSTGSFTLGSDVT